MKLSDLENRFKNFVLKSESNSPLTEEEKEMKNRIWSKVTYQKPRRKKIRLYPALAIAATIMLLMVSLIALKTVMNKNEMIGQLNEELETAIKAQKHLKMQFSEIREEYLLLKNQPPVIDTVTIYETRTIYKTPEFSGEDYMSDLNHIEPFEALPEIIVIGEDRMDLRNVRADIKDFRIEYGEAAEDGTVPWTFAVNYK